MGGAVKKSRLLTKYVYIDTSCFEDEDFDWEGSVIKRLLKLVEIGEVVLLTTTVTEKEVIKRIGIHLTIMREGFRNYKKGIIEQLNLVGVDPIITSKEAMPTLIRKFEQFLMKARIKRIPTTSNVNVILDQHFDLCPPFSNKKPEQFRDAIAIQSARDWAVLNHEKLYLVSKDTDWENCCIESSPFIYRKTIDSLVSDAQLLAQDKRKIRSEISRRRNVTEHIFDLISKLPVRLESLSPYQRDVTMFADRLSILRVTFSGANYFDLEVVEFDIDSDQLLCTARLEAEIYFDVPYDVCCQIYEDDLGFINSLRVSPLGGRMLYSDEMFRVEFEISEFDPSNLEKMRVGEVRLLNTSTKTKLYRHG